MKTLLSLINFIVIFLVITIAFSNNPLNAQEKVPERDLNAVADDLRFNDAAYFVKMKRDSQALPLLYEYLEIFDRGVHRDEAYRLIADIHRKRFEYQQAAKIYLKLYSEFTTSEAGVQAYFEAGLCYVKMGYTDRASEIFKDIIYQRPGTPIAERAQSQLDLINIINDKPVQ